MNLFSNSMQLKIILYLIAGASEDVESQKNGIVVMLWPGKCPSISHSNEGILSTLMNRKVASDLQMALPLRVVCIHFGLESSPLSRLVKKIIVSNVQQKTRFNVLTGTYI